MNRQNEIVTSDETYSRHWCALFMRVEVVQDPQRKYSLHFVVSSHNNRPSDICVQASNSSGSWTVKNVTSLEEGLEFLRTTDIEFLSFLHAQFKEACACRKTLYDSDYTLGEIENLCLKAVKAKFGRCDLLL
jgi:hypothetical protein